MIITASGEGCFKIQTGGVTILTEGLGAESASGRSRMKPDIFLRTAATTADLPDAGFIIKGPGEYELKEIEIQGLPPFTYIIKAEDMKLCLLSSPDQKVLDEVSDLDIIFISHNPSPPAGGSGQATLIRQLSPRLVITTPGAAKELSKELGSAPETTDKVTIKKREIPAEGMRLICLNP